jgi:lipopolysaccharide cholinephosphotransferase
MSVSMQPLSMAQTQEMFLGALDCLDSRCVGLGLAYFLLGGSLIGVVRDQELVPWDDDIYEAMPREGYERLSDEFEDTEEYQFARLRCTEGSVNGREDCVPAEDA